VFGQNSFRYF